MTKMVALVEFPYQAGSIHLKPGDEFEAEETDVRLLEGWAKARRKSDEDGVVSINSVKHRDRGGRYRRTDMQAAERADMKPTED